MNSFYYISLMSTTLLVPVSTVVDPAIELTPGTYEVCSTEGPIVTAIATCKLDNPDLSFEDKVRLCAIKMRPAKARPLFK